MDLILTRKCSCATRPAKFLTRGLCSGVVRIFNRQVRNIVFKTSKTLMEPWNTVVCFSKIDGFENPPQKIDRFGRTHRIPADGSTDYEVPRNPSNRRSTKLVLKISNLLSLFRPYFVFPLFERFWQLYIHEYFWDSWAINLRFICISQP